MEYVKASSPEQAIEALSSEKSFVLAGGTDLLRLGKRGTIDIGTLVDIIDIPGINGVAMEEDIKIGAATTLSKLAQNQLINDKFPVLRDAARTVATPQIRNMGTIGGNLLQDVQCWYYRSKEFKCLRRGGKVCHAIRGEHRWYHSVFKLSPCVAAYTSDMAPALAALNADAIIVGAEGLRSFPVEDLYVRTPPWRALKANEILKEIKVPKSSSQYCCSFLKNAIWNSGYFPIVNVAAAVKFEGEACVDARIFLGGVSPTLFRADSAEKSLLEKPLEHDKIEQAANSISNDARPLKNNHFKVEIAKVLIKRALSSIKRRDQNGKDKG